MLLLCVGLVRADGIQNLDATATTGLSDVSTGALTLSDNSGASLVFTGVSAKYDKIGDVIHAFEQFTFPSTANGANASISINGLPVNFPAAGYGRQCTVN